MEYLVTSEEMRRYDAYTIEQLGVPGIVLMERAAAGACEVIGSWMSSRGHDDPRIVVLGGYGNNGGDGIAIARMLMQRGCRVSLILAGDPGRATESNLTEQKIARNYGMPVVTYDAGEIPALVSDVSANVHGADIYIDALFGVGLTRPLSGPYAALADAINVSGVTVVAVDIPSGLCADGGGADYPAIRADLTVTFGFIKAGEILYPGAAYSGEVVRVDMGIDEFSINGEPPVFRRMTAVDDIGLPKRRADSNKSTCGKLLVIAGSAGIYGAMYLSAAAAFKTGAGMVRVITHVDNRTSLEANLPDAMSAYYGDETSESELTEMIEGALDWCDAILIGPGLGRSAQAVTLTRAVMLGSDKPVTVDADALRICTDDADIDLKLRSAGGRRVIMTPHAGEFAYMTGRTAADIKEHIGYAPQEYTRERNVTLICKDARSVISSHGRREVWVNTSGNDGMAVAGSGDVLAGICAVFVMQMTDPLDAAALAAYVHGLCGDAAAAAYGKRSMSATDIMTCISDVLMKEG